MNDFLKRNLFDTERTALCTCTSFAFKTVCVKKGLNNTIYFTQDLFMAKTFA